MSKNEFGSGHPRPRGARSAFLAEPSSGQYSLQHGTIPGFDGTPIFYCVEAPMDKPSAPPLVFCYGFACSPLHWTYQIDYFRQNYTCIWIDYRGHRRTPVPEKVETLTIDSIIRDIDSVLQFLEIPKAIFLGHSMGVNVVLSYALAYPEKTQGLVLANGTSKRPLDTLFGENGIISPAFNLFLNLEKRFPRIVDEAWKLKGKAEIFNFILGTLGFNKSLSHSEDIRAYAEQVASFPHVVMTHLMDDYEKMDLSPLLHKIKMPTLIISGEQDYITPPATQELIHQLIPGSELVRVRHGSHCTTVDLPELVNLTVEKFIQAKVL